MTEEERRILEKQLWAVADTLRGKMNADEYKNYILGFIFLKYLSEKQEHYAEGLLESDDGVDFKTLDEKSAKDKKYIEAVRKASLEHLGFFLTPPQLFSRIVKKGRGELGKDTFILEDLRAVFNAIENTSAGTDSEEDFKGLFADVDLSSVRLGKDEKSKNALIVEVLSHLSGIDFKLNDKKRSDVLGDAYEYLISKFAAGAGKKAGEFYTPAQVSRLMAMIVSDGKKKLRSVYDPTCGSGSLLLRVGEYAQVADYFGQELTNTTYNLARMNMLLHGKHFSQFSIANDDTLTTDMHPDLKAEAVVANPPFGAKWKGDADPVLAQDDRFAQYGRLAPRGAADYAFVTHMLYHLAENGTMAVVLPHGALFRGGAEAHIRKYIIEKLNYLDAVIGLPANIFYGTGIPATICVFKKCRKEDDTILFIEASREFEKRKNQNYLRDEDIAKIFDTYKHRRELDKYSHNATMDEIKENDYNLNITRYVDTFVEEEPIDITANLKELKVLEPELKKLEKEMEGYLSKLGIK